MSGFSRRGLMGGALAGAVLPACGHAAALIPRRGGAVRVATQSVSTADTLDPAKGALSTDYVRHYMLYSGLTKTGPDMVTRPSLAERIESADRITWHFALRRGVHFHDGAELTSADVVWSLRRHADPALGSKMAGIVKQFAQVTADGRYGVTIRLTGPNADLPVILAQSHFLILRAGATHPDGNGTGPYRLAQFKPGIRTIVTRNADYWVAGRPYLDRIELISIPDEVSRVNALLSGDVQLVNAINPRSTRRVQGSAGHAVLSTPSALYTNLIARQTQLPTGNPHFVAALKHLIDRDLVKRALFRGYATIGNDQPIPPFHRYYNPAVPQTGLDLDRARWHLQRGGLTGVRLPIYASPAAEGSVDMASILQEYGARVGLDLSVTRVPADGYWSTHWMKHPLTFGNTNPRPTADLVFSLFYKSDAAWNESGWQNPRFDQLLLAARAEADEARRRAMYGEMQQLVHDHAGSMIPVFINLIDGHDRRLCGLSPVPAGGMMGYQFAEYAWWNA
ncbi:ABC transporter substrate-binding protein [Novosphingobium ovatum]|nr:ABC transporter substrate-binding protein [Novosphingobium ovatum]